VARTLNGCARTRRGVFSSHKALPRATKRSNCCNALSSKRIFSGCKITLCRVRVGEGDGWQCFRLHPPQGASGTLYPLPLGSEGRLLEVGSVPPLTVLYEGNGGLRQGCSASPAQHEGMRRLNTCTRCILRNLQLPIRSLQC
jgi:hypothetical protein